MQTNLKLTQNGRSMVEMLGVLAIIGVLSVAGVQGYTIAMNKHRANEILNEASKRAIVVASQIASGRTPTLTEFTDNEVGGATFSQEVKDKDGGEWTASDSQFKIGFDVDPSDAVLAQMQNIAGTNGMILGFEGGLTYNNDLTAGTEPTSTDPEANECTGNTKPKSEGTGCECKPGYKEPDCMECASGYGIDSDDKCVACPSNSANDGDTAQETNVSGCYCNSGYEWDSTECEQYASPCYGKANGMSCTGSITFGMCQSGNCCIVDSFTNYLSGYDASTGTKNKACCDRFDGTSQSAWVGSSDTDGECCMLAYTGLPNTYATSGGSPTADCCNFNSPTTDGFGSRWINGTCCMISGNAIQSFDSTGNNDSTCEEASRCSGEGTPCGGDLSGSCTDGTCYISLG